MAAEWMGSKLGDQGRMGPGGIDGAGGGKGEKGGVEDGLVEGVLSEMGEGEAVYRPGMDEAEEGLGVGGRVEETDDNSEAGSWEGGNFSFHAGKNWE